MVPFLFYCYFIAGCFALGSVGSWAGAPTPTAGRRALARGGVWAILSIACFVAAA